MNTRSIPKRLNTATSCFYELPHSMTTSELTQYELVYRHRYKAMFKQRIGSRFFFELSTTQERDIFLNSLQAQAPASGIIVERVWIN